MYRKVFWYSPRQQKDAKNIAKDINEKGYIEDSIGRWTEQRMYVGEQPKSAWDDAIVVLDRPATESEIAQHNRFQELLKK